MADEFPQEGRKPPAPLSKGSEAEKVVQRLRDDKTLEALQQEALQKLRNDPSFNQHVQELVASSKAIRGNYQGPQRQAKLKDELEDRVADEALEKFWELLCSREDGMAITIEAHAQAALEKVLAEHGEAER